MISRTPKDHNLIFQSIFRFGKARHTHVAIALYNFSLIHAMPKSGVHMKSLVEYLNENRNFSVYRNKLAPLEAQASLLEEHLRHHNLQGYSLGNWLFTSWRHSFCSELAAKAYQKSGLRLTKNDKNPKRVFPIDIYRHVSVDLEWTDITQEYKEFFLDNENLEFLKKVADFERFNVELTQNMGYDQQMLANIANSVADKYGEKGTTITPPMNYWSNRLANRSRFWLVLSYWWRTIKEIGQRLMTYLLKTRK